MGSEGNVTDTVMTQVSLGGFNPNVTAVELTEFLEAEINGIVCRCRLKTSWTPPESYPAFDITDTSHTTKFKITDNYQKVEPHAFVHFLTPESAAAAVKAAQSKELVMGDDPLIVSLGPENPYHLSQRRRTVSPYKLSDVQVDIGTLVSQDEFYVAWKLSNSGVDFLVDPFDGKCRFCFSKDTAFLFKDMKMYTMLKCDFKLEFAVREINEIRHYRDYKGFVILLQLASSPLVWYRTADDDINHTVTFEGVLDDDDPWIRTTDLSTNGAIGRCMTYKLFIPSRHGVKLKKAIDYLKKRRVHEDHIRKPLRVQEEPDFLQPMPEPFFSIHGKQDIDFETLFMVNAVLHRGIFNQYQVTDDFYCLLQTQPKEVNIAALKHLCTYKRPVFDAFRRMKTVQEWIRRYPKLLKPHRRNEDIVEMRRLIITPTRAYCMPPEVELSNRVVRKYKEVSNRFLRVTFMDDGMQTMNSNVVTYYVAPIVKQLTSLSYPQKTRVFRRVRTILTEGFYLCGRKYSFLAFSSNQLRDRSAWFFAENGETSVQAIKSWMGKFTNRNIAKCAARMGQCFSSTYATVEVPPHEVNPELPDVERNGYVFSDGIGTITPDLAGEVVKMLHLDVNLPPAAYQIRYAGYKGVVACWPSKNDGIRLSLRPSMNKFYSNHTMLEICSWTKFQPGFLNRQIITLLSTLQVPDEIFWDMQEFMIFKLSRMLDDTDAAFEVLTASCADEGNTAAIMLSAGFKPRIEPHLRGMLTSIRAAQLWGLREKARIFVSSGRWLMGCLDELGVLEQGQCFVQVSNPSLENCFSKHGSRFAQTKRNFDVIKGFVVIAKNPCLHPGDVRILQAVDNPGLHHLYDCLVFPQKGERPHTNEASGSDLDGDLYFVTWDENLIPPSKKSWPPMLYDAAEAKSLNRAVNHMDIIEFFAKNMVNENLGAICNAHVVHADRSEIGALDEKCILLAELAATAVDFPKTGKIVSMPNHLKPKLYPDFMGKEDNQSYKSNKILGRLCRRVKDIYDDDVSASSEFNMSPSDVPYDNELEVIGSSEFISDAWDHKCSYNGQLNGLLGQYKVKKEEEIVTGHVWSMPKYNSKKQGELKERLKHSYTALRKEFRQIFDKIDEFNQLSEEAKNSIYEKKASAWYQVTYHPDWVQRSLDLKEPDSPENIIMLSFAWIAADYLARIKIRYREMNSVDTAKPVNSLVKYLKDRI